MPVHTLSLVDGHLHQRWGSTNGDHAGSQPLAWEQGEQGKPVTKMHTARHKWLNGCQNCMQSSPELIRGTRAARQPWLQGLFRPEWHWLKRYLIEFCLIQWPDYLAAAQLLMSYQSFSSQKGNDDLWPKKKKTTKTKNRGDIVLGRH